MRYRTYLRWGCDTAWKERVEHRHSGKFLRQIVCHRSSSSEVCSESTHVEVDVCTRSDSQFLSAFRERRDDSVEVGCFLCGIQVRAVQPATVARCASQRMLLRACMDLRAIVIVPQKDFKPSPYTGNHSFKLLV